MMIYMSFDIVILVRKTFEPTSATLVDFGI